MGLCLTRAQACLEVSQALAQDDPFGYPIRASVWCYMPSDYPLVPAEALGRWAWSLTTERWTGKHLYQSDYTPEREMALRLWVEAVIAGDDWADLSVSFLGGF